MNTKPNVSLEAASSSSETVSEFRAQPLKRQNPLNEILRNPGALAITGLFLASGGVVIYKGGLWAAVIVFLCLLIVLAAVWFIVIKRE
jgi:hypothetical protein